MYHDAARSRWRSQSVLGAAEADGGPASRWLPDRAMIDDLTQANPCLLSSYDRELFLANTPALEAAGLVAEPMPGMDRRSDGSPTGLIRAGSPALERIRDRIQPKSHERLLDENRAALRNWRSRASSRSTTSPSRIRRLASSSFRRTVNSPAGSGCGPISPEARSWGAGPHHGASPG